jgi:PAS domain S-box-containing protein
MNLSTDMTVQQRTLPAGPSPTPSVVQEPLRGKLDLAPVTIDAPAIQSPTYRQFLESLGVAVYTTDADGRITFFNAAAARFWGRRPELGELWCGSLRMYWPDGSPLPHDQCPMAIALRERRSVRGYEAVAERPDGSRLAFVPYPTVLEDEAGNVIGAVNVIIDVSDRTRAEEAADAARAVRDDFLGLVSHELRTPVTTIFGNAQMLAGRADLPPRDTAMLNDIAMDAERLRSVVENLLTLSRADTGAPLDAEPQILSRVLSQTIDAFERRHPGRPVVCDIERRQLIVEAETAHLELLIGNLLSNADKYSAPSEPIEVRLTESQGEARVVVLDRGIGIEPDQGEELFTTFYRSDAARKMHSGLGIGLSACRRIVQLLGGRVWARPRAGGGAEFGFALPLRIDPID